MPGTTLANRYTLLRPLGEGAMGLVWLAHDPIEGRDVALKVIAKQVGATEKSILQFKQEFQLMTQLRHPHCCAVYDYGVSGDGEPYFTMEVVEGHGVDERLPMAPTQVTAVLSQLLLALGYVHQLGFVHRDIKSANLRVKPDGTVKLMDFGLMDYVGRSAGAITGTVGYIAPEMVMRSGVDQRADLYAVGCLAYEMLTGQLPFVRPTPVEVLRAHATEPPLPLTQRLPGLDPTLARVVMKLLAKEPLDRFQSAFEALEALGAEVPAGLGGSLLTSPMVGRDMEQALLAERLAAVAAGRPGGAVLLVGPSGIGKSRLAEEFRVGVQLAAVPSARGACQAHAQTPYAPFVTALRSLLPGLRAHASDALDRLAPVLVKLLPELEVAPAADLDAPSKEKLRLQGAVAEALAALAERAGLVLILEDWHWADPLSQELWAYMQRLLAPLSALLVVTGREAPVGAEGWETATQLPLARLGPGDMGRMVGSMLGTPEVPADFLGQLAEASQGSPLYVAELLDHLVRSHALVKARGRWNTDITLTPALLPSSLMGLLLDKLEGLGPDAMALVRLGAVLGGTFGLEVLAHATGLDDDRLIAALNTLKMQQIVMADEAGDYRFVQDQLVGVVVASLAPEALTALHAAAAHALEHPSAGMAAHELPLERLSALATHSLAGGLDDRAIGYALLAGRRSAALHANADAERFFSAGLARLDAADTARPVERLAYLHGLADVLRVLGRTAEAKAHYEAAIPIAEEELLDHRALSRMLTSLGKVYQMANRLEDALACCHRSLQVAMQAGEPSEAIRSLLTSCRLHTFLGDADKALGHAERALQLAESADDRAQRVEALAFIGYRLTAAGPANVEPGIAKLETAAALAAELGDKVALANVLNLLGNAQNQLGSHQAARATFEQAQAYCQAIGSKPDTMTAQLNLAICDLALGRHAEARAQTRACRALVSGDGQAFFQSLADGLEALACAYTDQVDAAREHLASALTLAERSQNRYVETLVRQYAVEVALQLGDLPGAIAAVAEVVALTRKSGQAAPEPLILAMHGQALARLGERDAADAAITQALAQSRLAGARGAEARALLARAWWAMDARAWEPAREAAEAALAMADGIGHRRMAAEARGLLGELALAVGRDDAGAHFAAMGEAAEAIGARSLWAQARFGQAAASPYAPGATALAAEARAAMAAVLAEMGDEAHAAFLALTERQRVLEGNHIGFSLPLTAPPATARPGHSGPLGLNQGMMGF